MILIPFFVFASLFLRWEPSTETWGYWLFSRILSETGRFVVTDRSPLYTIYLIPFRLISFPYSLYIENIVTTSFLLIILVQFFKQYMRMSLALFASIIWLPFIQTAEPPVQKLALAFTLLAVMIRQRIDNRYYRAWFYSLLGFAYLFRVTYAPLLLFFALVDIFMLLKNSRGRFLRILFPTLKTDWPIALPVCLFLLFTLLQSPHKWNSATFSSSQWFVYKTKGIAITSFYNKDYINENYRAIPYRDIYFTNSQLFGNETTFMGAVKTNPKFLYSHFRKYFSEFFILANDLTRIKRGLKFFVLICLGALLATKGKITRLLFFGIIITLIGISTITPPAHRYLIPLIPIYVVSMTWYGKLITKILLLPIRKYPLHNKVFVFVSIAVTSVLYVFVSGGITLPLVKKSVLAGETKLMQFMTTDPTSYSLTASFPAFSTLTKACHGIMSLEYPFIAAFVSPLYTVYDVFEIPPFGTYANSQYDGLRPERINCLFISNAHVLGEGTPTNHRIRYKQYIKPYEDFLISQGAKKIDIDSYGYAVIYHL